MTKATEKHFHPKRKQKDRRNLFEEEKNDETEEEDEEDESENEDDKRKTKKPTKQNKLPPNKKTQNVKTEKGIIDYINK